jgi:segregation and condensation protein B
VTTDAFLRHFGLESLDALPRLEELKAAGLLDNGDALQTYSEGDSGLHEAHDGPHGVIGD